MFKQWFQKKEQSNINPVSSIKILIIEDSQVDAQMIKKAVEVCGFNSLVAYDGRTGVAMAKEHKPDLIILDYHLPDINGTQVLKELRGCKETALETVMILTVINGPEAVIDTFIQGADQFFKKPISVPFLAKQIQVMLRHPHKDNDSF
ncbi:MAG: response regulator [Candidatus Omnitrophota bacterium]